MKEKTNQRATLYATVLGSALGFIDFGAVGVILPTIQREFSLGISTLQWIVGITALFLSSLLLVGGALGDRYGRRRVYMVGVAGFAGAALAAGFAPDVAWLLTARAFQGVAAALLVPGSLALIAANIPEKERGRAYGTWAAASGLVAAGGPFVAGWLADNVTWRALFWIYVPVALLVLALLSRVEESRDDEAGRLDVRGAVLATLGLGGVAFGLIEGNSRSFSNPLVWSALAIGVVSFTLFILAERRAENPMVPLKLFRDRTFAGVNLATLLVYAALSGALFFVPFNLIQLQGYSSTVAGAASIPFALLLTLLSRPAGRVADRIGPRGPIIAGALVAGLGFLAFARIGIGGSYWTTFFPAYVLLGVGMATLIPALTTTVMSAAPARRAGVASGVNNAVSRTAGLLAVALFGVLALQVFTMSLPDDTRDALGSDVDALAGARAPESAGESDAARIAGDVESAFLTAFRTLMLAASALCAAGAGVVAWSVRGGLDQ